MGSFEDYYIVEYRYAVRVPINKANRNSVQTAVSTANSICERIHGFRPSNWFARIFKYSTKEGVVGVDEEYFYNPHGATVRTVDANWIEHKEMIEESKNVD